MRKHIEIENIADAKRLLEEKSYIDGYAFQAIDFTLAQVDLSDHLFVNSIFLGCVIPTSISQKFDNTNIVINKFNLPYRVFIPKMYSCESLYNGYDYTDETTFATCFDSKVYKHYIDSGKRSDDIAETLSRTLHDHSVLDAMYDYLGKWNPKDVVAIMGGHALGRDCPEYRDIALISKHLTEKGKLMVSGGGPGAMEATHLGAYLAGYDDSVIDTVLQIISPYPSYKDKMWLSSAFKVLSMFPNPKYESLSIPTWLYGHEPSTPFATHIAKLFENALREDGLLTIAAGGVIYSPGSAGTMQEIFQDAVQNHYLTFGYASPMAFLGVKYWKETLPAYTLLESMTKTGRYKNLLLSISDNSKEVEDVILSFK